MKAPMLLVIAGQGSIDRLTGALEAFALSASVNKSYSLKCRPTQRMF